MTYNVFSGTLNPTHLLTYSLSVETLQAEIVRCERFLKGVGHFDRPF